MKSLSNWSKLHPIVRNLILIRCLRSIGQGAMVVDLTLYLKSLHWSASSIGTVTSGAGLFGAALILLVGTFSDRIGRKPFLFIYELLTLLAALSACFTSIGIVLILAIVVAGFGRGQSGAAGPFSPAEQAWLARYVKQENRGFVFSVNNAVGFIGMAIGSILGGLPSLFHATKPLLAFRPIFLLVAFFSFICMMLLRKMQEEKREVQELSHEALQESSKIANARRSEETKVRHKENLAIIKLALVNGLNGLAVGLTGPMMAYWFSIRYGVSTAAIGTTLSIGFLITGISSVVNGYMAQKIGMVKSVTWMRIMGSAMMAILPFMPNFLFASILYVIRSAMNRGTQGNRSALSASLTRDQRRGFATSINALSMRLPSSIGPTLTGYMMDAGELNLPLYLTAGLQVVNAAIYQWIFGSYDQTKSKKSKKVNGE